MLGHEPISTAGTMLAMEPSAPRILMPISLISLAIKQLRHWIPSLLEMWNGSPRGKQNSFNAYRQSLAKEKARDLFTYLESLRELLPHKTNSEWFKENKGLYRRESFHSSLPEIQAKRDNADHEVSIQSRSTTD